jgi:hypothetical protein
VPSDDLALVLGRQDVGQRDGHTGARGPVETGVLDAVERRSDLDLGVALREVVDDRRDLALVGDGLHVRVVLGSVSLKSARPRVVVTRRSPCT